MMSEDYASRTLRATAKEREALHANHATSRPLSEDYEDVGLAGEFEFGRLCGLMPDLERRPGGDKGVDFMLPLVMRVDVKTARIPLNLIHEVGKSFCDVYVLAGYDEQTRKATCLGWAWGATLRAAPTKEFGHGVLNHYIPRGQLRPMSELLVGVGQFTQRGNP